MKKNLLFGLIACLTVTAHAQDYKALYQDDEAKLKKINQRLPIAAVLIDEQFLAIECQKQPLKFAREIQNIPCDKCPEDFQDAWRGHIADVLGQEQKNKELIGNLAVGIISGTLGEETIAFHEGARVLAADRPIQNVYSPQMTKILLKYGFKIEP